LDPDVSVVFDRKKEFRPHELGLHHGYPTLGKESFCDYQERIRAELLKMARQFGWAAIRVSPTSSVEETSREVAALIELAKQRQITDVFHTANALQPHKNARQAV
jgi:hypothetical protein